MSPRDAAPPIFERMAESVAVTPILIDFANGARLFALGLSGELPSRAVGIDRVHTLAPQSIDSETTVSRVMEWAESWEHMQS